MIDLTMSAFKLKATLKLCSPALNRRILGEMIDNGVHPDLASKLVDLPKHLIHEVIRERDMARSQGGASGGRNP